MVPERISSRNSSRVAADAERIRQGVMAISRPCLWPISAGKPDGFLGARRIPQVAFEIRYLRVRHHIGLDVLGSELDTGAEIGVHRALAIGRDEDHRPRRGRRPSSGGGRENARPWARMSWV